MNLAFNGNKPFDVETRHALSLPKKLDSRVYTKNYTKMIIKTITI